MSLTRQVKICIKLTCFIRFITSTPKKIDKRGNLRYTENILKDEGAHMTTGLRYATRTELTWYLDDLNHRQLFLNLVQGCVDVECREDEHGAFILLKIQEGIDPSDNRTRTFDEILDRLMFTAPSSERVQARAKPEWV